MKYEIKQLTEEEETFIEEKINVYGDSMAPSESHTEEEQLVPFTKNTDSMCLPLTRTSLWGMLAGLYRNDWTKIIVMTMIKSHI